MNASYTAKEGGYAYLYVSNEHPTQVDVYFDDISMSYTPSRIIQSNEYYPFGAQTARSWTRENAAPNNFLGNGGTEYNATYSQYDLDFRNYDPILGRLNQVDPMSHNYGGMSPYHFSFNNPVTFVDPSGASADNPSSWAGGPYEAGTPWSHNWMTGRPANQEGHGEVAIRLFWNEVNALREAAYGGGSKEEFVVQYGATYEFWMRGKDYTNKDDGSEVFNLQGYFLKPVFKATISQRNSSASYDFEFADNLTVDGKPTLGSTTLDRSRSSYSNGQITFHFNVKFDNVLFTKEFVEKNGENYWRAVVAHERGHMEQFMYLGASANAQIFNSGLNGDDLERLFLNIMDTTEAAWFRMNNDPGHSDANKRAQKFLASQYWDFLSTPPKY